MFTIKNIYFDGNSYAEWLRTSRNEVVYSQEEYDLAINCNMSKIDSIEFIDLNNNYCDIRIDNQYFFGVSKIYLLIDINEDYIKLNKRLEREMSNNPNPGGLY